MVTAAPHSSRPCAAACGGGPDTATVPTTAIPASATFVDFLGLLIVAIAPHRAS
jgi:hypothetical protein